MGLPQARPGDPAYPPDPRTSLPPFDPGSFELLAGLCPDSVLISESGTVVYANPAAAALLGPANGLGGRAVLELAAPELQPRLCALLEQAAGGASAPMEEMRLYRADGSLFDAELSCGPFAWSGRRAVLLLVRDISERKHTADRLHAELAAMNRLHELSTRLLATRDLSGALDEVLDAAIALLDADFGNIQLYDPDTNRLDIVVQRGFADGFLQRYRLGNVNDDVACAQALRGGQRVVIDEVQTDAQPVRFRGLAAAAGYRAVQATPLATTTGEVLGVLSTHFRVPHRPSVHALRILDLYALQAVELVDRLRKEQALRESQERFRRALQPRNVGIVFMDTNGTVHDANDALLQMSGHTREDLAVGALRWDTLTPPEWRPAALHAIEELRATGLVAPCEHEYLRKDGSRWHALCSVTRIGPNEAVGFVIDISDRKRAERALKEADRRKDEFLATLAHELRNPLAPISNAMYLLKAPGQRRRHADRLIDMVQRQVRHIVRLVDDLLEVSRITRGQIELRRAPVALAEILHNAVEANRPLIDARHHQLHVTAPPDALTLNADGVRLTQVFTNLLNNAAKYTPDGGQIWVETQAAGADALVAVRDSGIGITPHMLPRVFEMFVQGSRGVGEQGGLGIGLTMVRSLVELHDGSIEVRSEGHGRGSEFIVRLPLLSSPCGAQERPPAWAPALSGRRVLVVDDNHDAADSLGLLLASTGADARVVYSGAEAITVLDSYQPHAAVIDIGMPGMNGYQVAERIRHEPRHARMRLIALTGWGQNADRVRSRASGFDEHLTKPADIDALTAILGCPPAA
jgi:PAS domain S-box-containing protein